MIQLNRSLMHRFPIVYLFSGQKRASPESHYYFQETTAIFGKENVGSNVIEYTAPPGDPMNHLDIDEVKLGLIDLAQSEVSALTIFDTLVDFSMKDQDLVFEYSNNSVIPLLPSALEDFLRRKHGFNFFVQTVEFDEMVTTSEFLSTHYFARIRINPEFLACRSSQLSPNLAKAFSSSRYVDSQIPFFMMTTIAAGLSQAYPRK